MDNFIRALIWPLARAMGNGATRRFHEFHRSMAHCREIQDRRLARILRDGHDSDFGRRHGLGRVRSYEDFVKAVPLGTHAYVEPYIDRCWEGEERALLGKSQHLVMFALTSGTTGPFKRIPVTAESLASYRRGWEIWGIRVLGSHPDIILRPILQISGSAEEMRSPAGIAAGAISGLLARHQTPMVRGIYVSPPEVADIPDPDARTYAILRLSMARDVRWIITANPSTLVQLARAGTTHAAALIRDISDGTMQGLADLPKPARAALRPRLRRDRARAAQLRRILEQAGALLPRDYWASPVLSHWTGGATRLYVPQVRHYFGNQPIADIGLLASEGRMSIPISDETAAGPLETAGNFYEFVPAEEIDNLAIGPGSQTFPDDLTVLRAEALEIDRAYYVMLTNGAGLFRYHIGDMVRVTGRIGSTPVIEFLSRGNHTSSVTGEKLTEHQVVAAVTRAMTNGAADAGTFTMSPVWDDPPFYRLLLEVPRIPPEAPEALAERVDSHLCAANCEYASKRKTRRLGQVRVEFVTDGRLTERDRQLILSRRGRNEQFKHRFLE